MGGMQHTIAIAVTKVEYSNIQLQSKQLVCYTGIDAKTHKTSSKNQL